MAHTNVQNGPLNFLPCVSVLTSFVGSFSLRAILYVAVGHFGRVENLWAVLVHVPFLLIILSLCAAENSDIGRSALLLPTLHVCRRHGEH